MSVAAPSVEVADTVGAGDSFMGGLIDGLWGAGVLGGPNREALRAISDETLTAILERCARIAAITPTVLELRRQGVRDEDATGKLSVGLRAGAGDSGW